jgi:hypothetical protein
MVRRYQNQQLRRQEACDEVVQLLVEACRACIAPPAQNRQISKSMIDHHTSSVCRLHNAVSRVSQLFDEYHRATRALQHDRQAAGDVLGDSSPKDADMEELWQQLRCLDGTSRAGSRTNTSNQRREVELRGVKCAASFFENLGDLCKQLIVAHEELITVRKRYSKYEMNETDYIMVL